MLSRNPASAGLTLIEILIAIIVLTIGVVSILAIFPSSIKTASSSVEDTMAAKIAESVGDALSIAMRTASAEDVKNKKPSKAFIVHDGLPGGSYEFSLPLPVDPPLAPDKPRFFAHPAGNPAEVSAPSPKPVDVFKLGGADFIKQLLDDVRKGPDPSDSYDQYGFTFTVKRFDDIRPAEETGANFIPNPLFQFAIAVYRLPPDYKTRYKDELPQPVNVFVVLFAGK
jgi:type II secretory pathway pseudopilin PulG